MIPHSFPYPTRKRSRAPSSLSINQSSDLSSTLLDRYPTELIKLCLTGHSELIDLQEFKSACQKWRHQISTIIDEERTTNSQEDHQSSVRSNSPSESQSNSQSNDSSTNLFDVSDMYLPTPDAILGTVINAEMSNIQSFFDLHTESEAAARASMVAQAAERRKQMRRERYLRDKKKNKESNENENENDEQKDEEEKEEKTESAATIRRRAPVIKRGVFEGLDSVKLSAPVTHISHTLPIPESFGTMIPDFGALVSTVMRKDHDRDTVQLPVSLFASQMSLNTITNEAFENRVNKRVKQSTEDVSADDEKEPELVADDEILLRISIYATRSPALLIEVVVLGSQPLFSVMEMLDCCQPDHSASTAIAQPSSQSLNDSSLDDPFLVIEGTRYPSDAMRSVHWYQLTVRIGSQYHLCHKQHIHPVVITQVRAVHSGDADDRRVAAYPLLVHREPTRITLCGICRLLPSKKIVYNDYLCEDNPTWFCDPCYAALHETVEGDFLYEPMGPVYDVD